MATVALTTFRLVGQLSGTARIEAALVAVIVVIGVILMAKRLIHNSEVRKRKARHAHYYNRDAAHYGPGGKDAPARDGSTSERLTQPVRASRMAAAPSFTSSKSPASPRLRTRNRTSDRAKAGATSASTAIAQPATDAPDGASSPRPIPGLKPKAGNSVGLPTMPTPPPPGTPLLPCSH
ncbi:MAG: hypothetical protein WCI26_06260 [Acidimicrobiales bacterium]